MGWFFFGAAVLLGFLTLAFFVGVRREASRKTKFARARRSERNIQFSAEDVALTAAVPVEPTPRLRLLLELLEEKGFSAIGVFESPHRPLDQLHLLKNEDLRAVVLITSRKQSDLLYYELIGEIEAGPLLRMVVNPLADQEPKREGVMLFGLKNSPPDIACAGFYRRSLEMPLRELPSEDLVPRVEEWLRRIV